MSAALIASGGRLLTRAVLRLYRAIGVSLDDDDLGVTKTHIRPHTSNDNPFSESQFKTVNYRPEFPRRFGSLEHARDCSRDLIDWYNNEHPHSSLAFLTPHDVPHGLAERRLAERAGVFEAAYCDHPERFVQGPPKLPMLAAAVWINPPTDTSTVDAHGPGEEDKNKAGHQGRAPSVLPPTRRSTKPRPSLSQNR
ncbi:MAG: hypothetical protein CSA62_00315 [Planctomycetota bacterium]|nr:MAG: hypothetical protein CSA62_00315 [Planctomycetota bacterium]